MDEKYKKSFSEVYEILKLMPNTILDKIPQKFKNIIENERDKNYKIIIKEPLNADDFQYETIVLLGMIYRDFLCKEDEKIILQHKELQLEKEYEIELKNKFKTADLFNKRKETIKCDAENKTSLLIKEEDKKWYHKLFNLIKGIFK